MLLHESNQSLTATPIYWRTSLLIFRLLLFSSTSIKLKTFQTLWEIKEREIENKSTMASRFLGGLLGSLMLVGLVLLNVSICSAAEDTEFVLTLDHSNFSETVGKHGFIVVEFYAPWYVEKPFVFVWCFGYFCLVYLIVVLCLIWSCRYQFAQCVVLEMCFCFCRSYVLDNYGWSWGLC